MDYLPVVLRRGRPLLGTLCSDVGSSKAVCPQGRLLALVNGRGSVAVHSLTGDSSRESVDSSDTFSRSDTATAARAEAQQYTSIGYIHVCCLSEWSKYSCTDFDGCVILG